MGTKGLVLFSSFFLLWILPVCCSGTFVGYPYDTRDPTETYVASLLKSTEATSIEARAFVEDHSTLLDPHSNSNITVHLHFRSSEEQLQDFRASSVAWLKSFLLTTPPQITIRSIVVSGNQSLLHVLLPTLQSFHCVIRNFRIDQNLKVAAMLSLPQLEVLRKTHDNSLGQVTSFLKKTGSFLAVELPLNEVLGSGDLVRSVVKKTLATACTLLCDLRIPVVFNFRVPVTSTGDQIAELVKEVARSHFQKKEFMIPGILVGFSGIEEIKQSELFSSKVEEQSWKNSHRELLSHKEDKSTMAARHDLVTNPVTTPSTIPSVFPPTGVVTVPSTIPYTNPVTAPVTIPPPDTATPVTVPATFPPPSNVIPITNPATTPVTAPFNPPATNPVVYPFPPPTGLPGGIVPGTVPVPSTGSGQSWCVARTGSSDAALQIAIDYACGIGGADCSAIQQTGSCFVPNTLRDHASYAFNSYYQKNPTPASCDFGGTAMLVNVNPSIATCMYPASSSSSSTLNANPSPGATTTVFGSTNPISSNSPLTSSNTTITTTTSESASVSIHFWFLITSITILYLSKTC